MKPRNDPPSHGMIATEPMSARPGVGAVGGVDVVARHPHVAGREGLPPVLLDVAAAAVEAARRALDLELARQPVAERDDAVKALHERHEPVPAHDSRFAQRHRPGVECGGVSDAAPQLRQVERDPLRREGVAADAHREPVARRLEVGGVEPVVPAAPRQAVEHLHERLVALAGFASRARLGQPAEHPRNDRPPLRAVGRHELDVPALEVAAVHTPPVEGLGVPHAAHVVDRGSHGATLWRAREHGQRPGPNDARHAATLNR